ncbi:MAG: hydantoinase/oxoprolinase family protein [Deltaproteobacteria bacterium]|nr:hydantoinase/oxoprolinase family protein [Deltaproteobacteria bacterium]
MKYRLGIDVGGTNTDAVILDESNRVIAKCKRPTTQDISTGIKQAVESVLNDSGIDPASIEHAMLGTTHATNAIVERKGLAKVGVLRLGAPCGLALPPMMDWPQDMSGHIGSNYKMVKGGYEFDGRLISQPDEREIESALLALRELGIEALAVSCVFSPVNSDQEIQAGKIAKKVFGDDFSISLSSEVGTLGILERENATILNAAILKIADKAYGAFQDILKEHNIGADLFITQNDGTLMSVDYARRYPVFTIASGPTNSIRGAAFLSGLADCVVVDVGGTTTDVGILKNGFPRESSIAVEIGGVRTNFRMPDLISIGLGGGSLVKSDGGSVTVGPKSVGYRITEEALIFGGSSLTATDVAVACGQFSLGDPALVSEVDMALCRQANARIKVMVEEVIDRIKTSAGDIPVVLVGGGSIIVPRELKGASEVIVPDNFDVANAIGAAISQVSGSIDGVFDVASKGRDAVVVEVKQAAIEEAIKAGAREETVEIVDFEEIPLAYLPSNAVRFRVKAVGELK